MRRWFWALSCLLVHTLPASGEVTGVTITSRVVVADGHAFGATGSYERLLGRIDFALDPAEPHNARIVDLEYAPRGADGRVHFSSDLYVLRPTDPTKGNGVLLFEAPNRGAKVLGRFNLTVRGVADGLALADFGDALLLKDGYTLVAIGWELGLSAPRLGIDAPSVALPPGASAEPIDVDLIVDARTTESFLVDERARPPVIYPPADLASAADRLTVRDLFWDEPVVVARDRWRFVIHASEAPKVQLDGGFDPGRWYRVTYRPTAPVVAGVGLAAFREAASAFRYRSDLPIRGRAAYLFGISQTGRFARQFLYDGFNADENGRRVFDAIWAHIAGAARGSFNERFAVPSQGDLFETTQFPFTDAVETDVDGSRGGLLSRYTAEQLPKIFYTNTPVEYWTGGRAAALTHTSVDGARDLALPENVRMYLLAGAQHGSGPFPPPASLPANAPPLAARNLAGQQLSNPTPQDNVMRALLRALHVWVADGTPPPPSAYPRLADGTLVRVQGVKFPALPGVADPRVIVGPGRRIGGKVVPLPHLVPQVDVDGNDIAGIHDPEVAVPLATTTAWNFRSERVGNPHDIFQLLGSYIPFPKTRAAREARGDPRLSIEERYGGVDEYLERVRAAATELIEDRYLLEEDLPSVLARARQHWDYATSD
jgi:Alpha/beta hydrolase domain